MGVRLSLPFGHRQHFDLVRVMPDDRSLFRALDAAAFLGDHPGAGDPWQRLADQSTEDAHWAARADQLRQRVCDALLERRADVEPLICGSTLPGAAGRQAGGFEAYCLEMRQFWLQGGKPELTVAPHVLQRPIAVFSPKDLARGRPGSTYAAGLAEAGACREPLLLLHYSGADDIELPFRGRGHYGVLIKGDW